ncbi:MAG: beta-galactosidase [Crenarchaeota archaeon]|nr:beta-galactosidase [Thermoproteota archaeon]
MKNRSCGGSPPFRFGVDYYPEHWPRERWATDAKMMAELGFNTARLAEFAWSRMEPVEGKFDFNWLDEAIETLSKHGIKVILGTPTAAPPPWLVKAHPDILQVDAYGRRKPEGTRKNCCAVNPNYIEHTKRIVEAMVLHYKDNPSVIGWQIDNEFDLNLCYCENSIRFFRNWLKEKYGSVNRLNSECGLVFWSQEYGSWDEVFPPRPPFDMQNPALCLEWHRFSSEAWVNYQRLQVEIIRRHAPHHMVTHNFMGLYKELDYFKLARDLDFVSFDYYPKWTSKIDYAASAMAHDVMRSLKKKPYWIMELQSGAVKTSLAPIPKPGEIRLWAVQSVARGADGVLYFRWRSCRFGTEEYWHGILDHDSVPRRRFFEVKKVSRELFRIAPYFENTFFEASTGIILVYDNLWAWDLEVGYGGENYYGMSAWEPVLDIYRALYRRNILVDFVDPFSDDLNKYHVLFAPSLMLLNNSLEDALRSYVEKGGVLVSTPRTGAKDWNNNIVDKPLPGRVADLFGVTVEEYTGLPGGESCDAVLLARKVFFKARNWMEKLAAGDSEVFAEYSSGIYMGEPAATIKHFGKGIAIYVGTFASAEFYDGLVDWLIGRGVAEEVLPSASGVEATRRKGDGKEIIFLLNHRDGAVELNLSGRVFRDLVSGDRLSGSVRPAGLDFKAVAPV